MERLFITPDTSVNQPDLPIAAQPMTAVAHADVKGSMAGARSSYEGAVAAAAQAKERRNELLAKYAAE